MRSWYLVPSLVLAAAVHLHAVERPPAAPGERPGAIKSWERKTVSRDWRQQYFPMTADLNMWLVRRVRQPNGTIREVPFYAWLRLDVRVSFAPLRAGESEEFEVQARDYGFSGDDPVVYLEVRPLNTYHYYFRQAASLVIRNAGTTWQQMVLSAGGRMRLPAPTTVDHMSVSLTTPTSPVSFTWQDYGAADNPGTTSEYRFRVGRARTLAPDVVVAEGELGTDPRVTLTPDSPFAQGHSEYFREGEKYRLVVWMRRKGSDVYTEEWGPAEWGTFTFRQGTQVMEAPLPGPVALPRQERFEALYSGR